MEGLRARYVCSTTPGCRRLRNAPSYSDYKRINPRDHSYIGNSRVFPAAQEDWFADPPPSLTEPTELMTNDNDMLVFNDGSRVVVNDG